MEGRSLYDNVIKKEKYWPVVESCYSRTWKGYRMPPHMHERVEIMYVLKGKCLIHFFQYKEDEENGSIRIVARHVEKMGVGEFVIVDKGVLHALEVPDSSYMANVEFAIRPDKTSMLSVAWLCKASHVFEYLLTLNQPFIRGVDHDGKVYEILAQVITDFSGAVASSEDRTLHDLRIGQMLLTTAQELKMAALGVNGLSYVRKAMQLMKERMEEDIRIADIADEIGIASSYLQRLFKQIAGLTMIDYLNNLRIERSKLLLIQTEDPIVDVAVAVGYNSRQHFCRVFTRTVGTSPQKYRQAKQSYESRQLYMFENVRDILSLDSFLDYGR